MSYGEGSNRTTFADGVGITSTDLTQIGLNASQRAWDFPGYADLLAFDLVVSSPATAYDNAFNASDAVMYGRRAGVFTVGGGLVAGYGAAARQSQLGAGFAGVWNEGWLAPPISNNPSALMSWVHLQAEEWAPTHAAASAGNTRWDFVHCAVERTNLSATRNYEDAATGEKTSATTIIAEELALDIAITSGTESAGTPTPPSLPSGRHALYMVLVSDTAITEIHDFVIPVGSLRTVESKMRDSYGWTSDGTGSTMWMNESALGIKSTAGSDQPVYLFPPDDIIGDPNARILGVRLNHKLKASDTVKAVSFDLTTGSGSTVLADFTSQVTLGSGTALDQLIDMRGGPSGSSSWFPMFAQGAFRRSISYHRTFALRIGAAASGSIVYGATWYYIKG